MKHQPGVVEGFSISVLRPNEYLGELSCSDSKEARTLYALGATKKFRCFFYNPLTRN